MLNVMRQFATPGTALVSGVVTIILPLLAGLLLEPRGIPATTLGGLAGITGYITVTTVLISADKTVIADPSRTKIGTRRKVIYGTLLWYFALATFLSTVLPERLVPAVGALTTMVVLLAFAVWLPAEGELDPWNAGADVWVEDSVTLNADWYLTQFEEIDVAGRTVGQTVAMDALQAAWEAENAQLETLGDETAYVPFRNE
jgi:MFS family permease